MADSVMKDLQGPDWPLGLTLVVTPGTPVSIMALVDASAVNDPSAATSSTSQEYTVLCQQIQFQAFKKGASHGLTPNAGNIYIVRKGNAGAGNRDDYGAIVTVLTPGQSYFLGSAARNRNSFSPYRYYIDADNASDGCNVTLVIQ